MIEVAHAEGGGKSPALFGDVLGQRIGRDPPSQFAPPQTRPLLTKGSTGALFAPLSSADAPNPTLDQAVVRFTTVTGSAPLTKSFALDRQGKPIKCQDAALFDGTATRVELRGSPSQILAQFAARLKKLSANQAIILAPPPDGKVAWPVVVKAELQNREGAIARTRDFFRVTPGPAIIALDFDIKDYPPQIIAKLKGLGDQGLSKALALLFPAFNDAQAGADRIGERSEKTTV